MCEPGENQPTKSVLFERARPRPEGNLTGVVLWVQQGKKVSQITLESAGVLCYQQMIRIVVLWQGHECIKLPSVLISKVQIL